MKKMKVPAALTACVACLLSLFGCRKGHMTDGPGMINDLAWNEFTVSRSDSYTQFNFWFTVQRTDEGFFLTGECRDEDGNLLTNDKGIRLSSETVLHLRNLKLGKLRDVQPEPTADELILLDAPQYSLVLTYLDGTQLEKAITDDSTLELYLLFLPYMTA